MGLSRERADDYRQELKDLEEWKDKELELSGNRHFDSIQRVLRMKQDAILQRYNVGFNIFAKGGIYVGTIYTGGKSKEDIKREVAETIERYDTRNSAWVL